MMDKMRELESEIVWACKDRCTHMSCEEVCEVEYSGSRRGGRRLKKY